MLLWLEGYKYTIKYDDGDAEEFSEKGGGKYIKTIQFKNAIIVAYVSNDGNISIATVNGTNHQRNHPITIVGHLVMTATEGIERLKFLVAIITRSFFTPFFKGEV